MAISTCPICDSEHVTCFLTRDRVPVHQNLVMGTVEAAREIARGELAMTVCENCGFVFNRAFDLERLSYSEEYDNTQSYSPSFEAYLDSLVDELVDNNSVRNCLIVEVGCGKGTFLRKLVEADPGNRGVGFDPTYVGPEETLDGRLRFERRFYGEECAGLPADVVVCRHVIEHVPEPLRLLRAIRNGLGDAVHARIFFETPNVEWILENEVIWDFFYEHCSLFTPGSLRTAFQRAGFSVDSIRSVFGGQYLWIEASIPGDPPTVTKDPGQTARLANAYAQVLNSHFGQWRELVERLRGEGGVALWGAGAKGVTFANLLDPHRELFACVVDLNPQKQGNYLPGTGHPIEDYTDLPRYGVSSAITMNPIYLEENRLLLARAGLNITLISYDS